MKKLDRLSGGISERKHEPISRRSFLRGMAGLVGASAIGVLTPGCGDDEIMGGDPWDLNEDKPEMCMDPNPEMCRNESPEMCMDPNPEMCRDESPESCRSPEFNPELCRGQRLQCAYHRKWDHDFEPDYCEGHVDTLNWDQMHTCSIKEWKGEKLPKFCDEW